MYVSRTSSETREEQSVVGESLVETRDTMYRYLHPADVLLPAGGRYSREEYIDCDSASAELASAFLVSRNKFSLSKPAAS